MEHRNICKIGRQSAGMTQERWAEALGCSVEAVRGYERGDYLPSDDMALNMADAAGMPVLSHWHLYNKSALARELLPEVQVVSLPMATLRLLTAIRRFVESQQGEQLMEIAEDGKVSPLESMAFDQIQKSLQGIVTAAAMLKYAKAENIT